MAIAYYQSLEHAEAVEVVFLRPQGSDVTLRLLVDSGFAGESSFVLPEQLSDLAQASAPKSQVRGALRGAQRRSVVLCRIPQLSLQFAAPAILADMSTLALPVGVQGQAGLQFLRPPAAHSLPLTATSCGRRPPCRMDADRIPPRRRCRARNR